MGYLVEEISGQDFNLYCRENIFKILGMENTGWFLSEVNADKMALPYEKSKSGFKALPFYGFPTYPDGCLKTSSSDYAKFLMAFINKGEYKGQRILEEKTVDEILQNQVPEENQGLTWDLKVLEEFKINTGKQSVPGHSGGDPGIMSLTFFLPDSKTGAIIFINRTMSIDFKLINVIQMFNRLFVECKGS